MTSKSRCHSLWAALTLTLLVTFGCGGSNKTYSRVIGATGGTLIGPENTQVTIPAAALSVDATIIVTASPGARRPTGTASVATPITLGPEGQTFDKPVEITIPIAPSALPNGRTIDDVVVVRAPHNSNVYVPVPTRRVGNAVVAETEHFSDFIAVVLLTAEGGTPFGTCGDSQCVNVGETCSTCPFDCGLCLDAGMPDAGVDAGFDGGPPSVFVDNGDGSVTDTRTSLQWESAPVPGYDFASAQSYCIGLGIGGHSDWRIPSVQERLTLLDYTRIGPAVDVRAFSNKTPVFAWTNTGNANDPMTTWAVDMDGGSVVPTATSGSGPMPWCVRGASTDGGPVIVDNSDGTATDTSTGLMYQTDYSSLMAYSAASGYCDTLVLGSVGPWRAPSIVELARITRFDQPTPAIDSTIFTTSAGNRFWSSSPVAGSANSVWTWAEDSGTVDVLNVSSMTSIRCVH